MVNDSIPDIVTIIETTSKNSNSNDISESDGNNLNKMYAGLNQRNQRNHLDMVSNKEKLLETVKTLI